MALNIKDAETDRLARELAAATGESITVAARTAIEERLARVRVQAEAVDRRIDLSDLILRARSRPDTGRAPDEILGFDADGLPQ